MKTMKFGLFLAFCIIFLLIFASLLIIAIYFVVNIFSKLINYIYIKKHKKWFSFFNEYEKKIISVHEWYSNNVSILKNEIDNLNDQKNYAPVEELSNIKSKLNKLKKQYYSNKVKCKKMYNECIDYWNTVGSEIAKEENILSYERKNRI